MSNWQNLDKTRDDDPYHAWARHVRLAQGNDDAQTQMFCPLVVQLKSADGTKGGLVQAIFALMSSLLSDTGYAKLTARYPGQPSGGAIAPEPAVVSALSDAVFAKSEIGHVKAMLDLLSDASFVSRTLDDKDLYAQILLLYLPEAVLFPRSDHAAVWDNDLFSIRFAGQALPRLKIDTGGKPKKRRGSKRRHFLTVIDDSMAFLNRDFVRKSGKTCFDHVWFQDGARLRRKDINLLLADMHSPGGVGEREMYERTHDIRGQVVRLIDHGTHRHQPLAFETSHGTHVAATALRAFRGEGGKLRKLGLSAITLPTDVTQDTSGAALGFYLIAALRQAMLWNDVLYRSVDRRHYPLVINCSYGFLAGAKDGFDSLSAVISDLLFARNKMDRPTAFVVPMGNQYTARAVAVRSLAPGETLEVDWVIAPDDRTASFLELFAKGDGAKLSLSVTAPFAHAPLTVPFEGDAIGKRWALMNDHTRLIAEWSEWQPGSHWPRRAPETSQWALQGALCLGPSASLEAPDDVVPAGRWSVAVTNTSAVAVEVLAMVQRDDTPGTYPRYARQSFLDHPEAYAYGDETTDFASASWDQFGPDCPLTHARTASLLASMDSDYVFAVGAGMGPWGDADDAWPVEASLYSGAGRRNAGLDGPEYSDLSDRSFNAPGIFGAGTYSGQDVTMNGSSVAAPQTAGYLAAHVLGLAGFDGLQATAQATPQTPPAGQKSARFGLVRQKASDRATHVGV
jgi:hypothetical protein